VTGGGNPAVDFRGQRRTNATHQSTTDPDARLYRKSDGRPAQPAYGGHVLMENRSGLIVDARVTPADGYGEYRRSNCGEMRASAQSVMRRIARNGWSVGTRSSSET